MAWKLWENGISHIDRYNESNGITDRFNGAVWTIKFSRKDTMHWNGTKQMFANCVIFSWFCWEVELATLGLIAIRDLGGQIFSLTAKQWQTRLTENLATHVRDPTSGIAALLPSPSEESWPACNWSQSRLNLSLRGLSPNQKSRLFT